MNFKSSAILIFAILLSSCTHYLSQSFTEKPASIGTKTKTYEKLKNLPKPEQKIITAVYKFRDQTGQYKPSETGANWSTAVSQGTTSILLKAIEESGWFIPIEREGLSNLLNERKIIRSSRENYEGNNAKGMPPLLFGDIILEGGIISYDANIMTGGFGARYFGTGGSTQYRMDRVTVYLRAVSTTNGQILKTVYTSKTILSQKIDASIFRYVKLERLLEAETGFTYNEPTEMAVKEAIELSVRNLIIEGILGGLWKTSHPDGENNTIIREYAREKDANLNADMFNIYSAEHRDTFGVELYGGSWLMKGDYNDETLKPSGGISFSYSPWEKWMFSLNISRGQLKLSEISTPYFENFQLTGRYNLFPQRNVCPFFYGGIGTISKQYNDFFKYNINRKHYFTIPYGIGIEYMMDKKIGVNLSLGNNFIFSDSLDEKKEGDFNDYFWEAKLGLKYYFSLKRKRR